LGTDNPLFAPGRKGKNVKIPNDNPMKIFRVKFLSLFSGDWSETIETFFFPEKEAGDTRRPGTKREDEVPEP
jgi:hypothetical protein